MNSEAHEYFDEVLVKMCRRLTLPSLLFKTTINYHSFGFNKSVLTFNDRSLISAKM